MNWPYIAGFFDGEGTVNFRSSCSFATANISQTGKEGFDVFTEMQKFLNERGITPYIHSYGPEKYRNSRPAKREIHRLDFANRISVVGLLNGIFPYLRIKKLAAQDVLRFAKLYPPLMQNHFYMVERQRRMIAARKRNVAARKAEVL